MRVLLDTNAILWALDGSEYLSELARRTTLTLENEALVSSVYRCELAIKRALGKLDAPRELDAAIDDGGFVRRLIRFEDCEKVDGAPVVTRDPWVARYGVDQTSRTLIPSRARGGGSANSIKLSPPTEASSLSAVLRAASSSPR
jgi:PIN domain nuclease of toxin-antitoxin system